jgi:hypothetical protein
MWVEGKVTWVTGRCDMGGRDCNVAGCGSGMGCRSCAVGVWDCNVGGGWKGRDHLGGNWEAAGRVGTTARATETAAGAVRAATGAARISAVVAGATAGGLQWGAERVLAWAAARAALCK